MAIRNGTHAGFVVFGMEDHLFWPRKTGFSYAFYIVPDSREGSLASLVMQECCRVLDTHHPSKIQPEVIEGHEEADRIWTWMGFRRVSIQVLFARPKVVKNTVCDSRRRRTILAHVRHLEAQRVGH
jgi:hypothetical protein